MIQNGSFGRVEDHCMSQCLDDFVEVVMNLCLKVLSISIEIAMVMLLLEYPTLLSKMIASLMNELDGKTVEPSVGDFITIL